MVRSRASPASFALTVTDADGAPVQAQLSVGVVDEAVYGVKPDGTPDPLRFFYRLDYSTVSTDYSRDYSFTGYAGSQQLQLAQRRRPFTLADFKREGQARPQVRKDFPDAIYWAADVTTDAQGRASVRGAVSGRADDVAAYRACRHGRHPGRGGRGAHDDDEGSHPARRRPRGS